MTRYSGPNRREALSDLEMDAIVQKVIDKVAAEVGKSVIRKVWWAVGIVALGLAYWFRDHWPK